MPLAAGAELVAAIVLLLFGEGVQQLLCWFAWRANLSRVCSSVEAQT